MTALRGCLKPCSSAARLKPVAIDGRRCVRLPATNCSDSAFAAESVHLLIPDAVDSAHSCISLKGNTAPGNEVSSTAL